MSKPIDVHEHARICAGLHKNAGTSGIPVVFVTIFPLSLRSPRSWDSAFEFYMDVSGWDVGSLARLVASTTQQPPTLHVRCFQSHDTHVLEGRGVGCHVVTGTTGRTSYLRPGAAPTLQSRIERRGLAWGSYWHSTDLPSTPRTTPLRIMLHMPLSTNTVSGTEVAVTEVLRFGS